MADVTISMSKDELRAMMRDAVSEAFRNVGIRHDDDDEIEDTRADFRFLRHLRQGIDGAQSKVGAAVITTIVGGFFVILTLGLKSWFGK